VKLEERLREAIKLSDPHDVDSCDWTVSVCEVLQDLAGRLKKAMEAIELLQSKGDPCETCYEAGCTGNSSCYDCRDDADQTCHDRAYARKQKAGALIREIEEPPTR